MKLSNSMIQFSYLLQVFVAVLYMAITYGALSKPLGATPFGTYSLSHLLFMMVFIVSIPIKPVRKSLTDDANYTRASRQLSFVEGLGVTSFIFMGIHWVITETIGRIDCGSNCGALGGRGDLIYAALVALGTWGVLAYTSHLIADKYDSSEL